MKQRKIWTKIWKDDWFYGLSQNARFLFLYLISNDGIGFTGCYELSDRQISFDTKIPNLEKAKQELSPKIKFYNGWVYVTNSQGYNGFVGESFEIAIEKEKLSIPQSIVNTLIMGKEGVTPPVTLPSRGGVSSNNSSNNSININNNISNKDYMESITLEVISEIANKYLVPESFVKSKLEDIELWEGEKPGRMKGRNWKLTLMNWVKRDALKIKGDYAKQNQYRGIDASNI